MSVLKNRIPIPLLHLNNKYTSIKLKKYTTFFTQVISRAINFGFLIIRQTPAPSTLTWIDVKVTDDDDINYDTFMLTLLVLPGHRLVLSLVFYLTEWWSDESRGSLSVPVGSSANIHIFRIPAFSWIRLWPSLELDRVGCASWNCSEARAIFYCQSSEVPDIHRGETSSSQNSFLPSEVTGEKSYIIHVPCTMADRAPL